MSYLSFTLWFTVIHTVAYTLAGAIALKISGNLYREKERRLDFLRDMSNPEESAHVSKWFLPAQLVRGALMSVVLYPVLGALGELSFGARFAFLAGLMFVYTDLASAVPFTNNLEGAVYMKKRYVQREGFFKLYLETALYSAVFGGGVSWLTGGQ